MPKTRKRRRPSQPALDLCLLPALQRCLHEQARTSWGLPLNAYLLFFAGGQAIAACCRAALGWACVSGRRVLRVVDDNRGPPFVDLQRTAADLVEVVHLTRDGRQGVEAAAAAIVECRRAKSLLCTYKELTGLAAFLPLGPGVLPCLWLQQVRCRGCRLSCDDVVCLLRCSPKLERLVLLGEELRGLGEALRGESELCPCLRHLQVADGGMTASDAAELLRHAPKLESLEMQSMSLAGLRIPKLGQLRSLRILDGCLGRSDAWHLMAHCKGLESLELCGNPLGDDGSEESSTCWPGLPKLRRADLRFCALTFSDEEALRESLPPEAAVECRVSLQQQGPQAAAARAGGHVVFESSSESESGE